MAPEIFEKKYRHAASTPVAAATPFAATPTRLAASTPLPPPVGASTPQASHPPPASTPGAQARIEREQQNNDNHRDIWAFGCVLYELATHRRPWCVAKNSRAPLELIFVMNNFCILASFFVFGPPNSQIADACGAGTKSCRRARHRLARKTRDRLCKPTSICSFCADFGET